MKNSFYSQITKYKARLIMASKVVFVLSLILFSIWIIPQILPQENKEIWIDNIFCTDSDFGFRNLSATPFIGLHGKFYDCSFNLEKKPDLSFSNCVVSINVNEAKKNISFLTININKDRLDEFNEKSKFEAMDSMKFDIGYYNANFILKCDNIESYPFTTTIDIKSPDEYKEYIETSESFGIIIAAVITIIGFIIIAIINYFSIKQGSNKTEKKMDSILEEIRKLPKKKKFTSSPQRE